nr:uncharacterized protein LOC104113999 [Nicotiana tomentosiformis]
MTCTNCGEANHNARGCEKPPMTKRARKNAIHLVDEDDSVVQQLDEEIHLTAPQSSQANQSRVQGSNFVFMPTPSMHSQSSSPFPDFDLPELDSNVVTTPTIMSESKTRLLQRQKPPQTSNVRVISFTGDTNGVSLPSSLPFKPPGLKWKGKSIVTGSQLEIQSKKKVDKLKPRRGSN